jgi:hypothetical protein
LREVYLIENSLVSAQTLSLVLLFNSTQALTQFVLSSLHQREQRMKAAEVPVARERVMIADSRPRAFNEDIAAERAREAEKKQDVRLSRPISKLMHSSQLNFAFFVSA